VPICCALRFAFEEWRDPEREQASERGIAFSKRGWEFVPCEIFHRRVFTQAEYERRLNAPG